MFEILKSWRKI